jgi:lipopolysaccharide transport system permease protein
MIATLYRQRGLLAALVSRDVGARYRGTFLGYLWSLLNPLLLLTVYTVVFTVVLPARVSVPVPFPLFLFAGLLPWLFASGALIDAAIVLADNGPLLKKVVCPPEVFPTVKILSHLVHHVLALPVLVAAVVVASLLGRMEFPWTMFLVPVALLPWVIAVSGMVFGVAALAIHFRDLKDLLQNLLNLVFFLTPIIYTPELVPAGLLRRAVLANPVTPLVTVYRDAVLFGRISPLSTWGWAFLVAGLSWWFGTWVFWQLRDTLAEAV